MSLTSSIRKQLTKLLRRPRHIRISVMGKNVEDCLRLLEKSARLPEFDLSIRGEPEAVTAWLAMRNGQKFWIQSRTSEKWKADPEREGYIFGSIFESGTPPDLTREQLEGMSPLIAAAISTDYICIGSLNISRHCPGIYRESVCTTCGDIDPE